MGPFAAFLVNLHTIGIKGSSATFAGYQLAQMRHPVGLRRRRLIHHHISRAGILCEQWSRHCRLYCTLKSVG